MIVTLISTGCSTTTTSNTACNGTEAVGLGGERSALTHNNDTFVLGAGPFRSGSVLDQREKAVDFNGAGGILRSNPIRVARGPGVHMIDQSVTPTGFSEVPQIAELPDAAMTE